jgi:hypothetical protein
LLKEKERLIMPNPSGSKFKGAYIIERGVKFAIVTVEEDAVQSETTQKETMKAYQRYFPDAPIILMVEKENDNPEYYGRKDIVSFLYTLEPEQIKWKTYTIQ